MEKLKFTLLSIIVLFLLGLAGYWAIATIQTGSESAMSQKITALQKENADLSKQVEDLNSQLGTLEAQQAAAQQTASAGEPSTPADTQPSTPTTATYKYQSLINDLQKLIDGKVFMKLHSQGTRVGTVQKFLNIYNNTSTKIDNDYGPSTVKAVTAFQKDQGLSADGQAGPSTFSKMISWLKKQG